MQLAYLEPSAIDAAARLGPDGTVLRDFLASTDYLPALGHHTLHELARTVVYGHTDTAKIVFTLVSNLNPILHQPPDELFRQELLFLRDNRTVQPNLDLANEALTRSEIELLAQGHISDQLRFLIQDRDRDKKESWPVSTNEYLAQIRELRRLNPPLAPRPGVFDDVVRFLADQHHRLIQAMTVEPLVEDEAQRIIDRLDSLPAHRAHLYLWLYLIFICLRDKRAPSGDKLDDFRHLVEASYCHAFVTNDDQLAAAQPHIQPRLRLIRFESLASGGDVSRAT